MNFVKSLLVALSLILSSNLNAQQATPGGGGSGGAGGGGGNTIVPVPAKPSSGGGGVNAFPPPTPGVITIDRLEADTTPEGLYVMLYGNFPNAPTGVTISQGDEWISFLQNWSGENVIKIPVDVSLPTGTYQIAITQGTRRSNQLSFTLAEGGQVIQVPLLGGKILSEPNNDLAPRINSFEPRLTAGWRTVITGERFTPPVMVRIEGNSGDVAWARRVTPTSEGTVEFVVPNTHFGSLVLVVDNGKGTARVTVTIDSPPTKKPPQQTEPEVTKVEFREIAGGGIAGFVTLASPLSPTSILVLASRVKDKGPGEGFGEIRGFILLFSADEGSSAAWEDEIADVERQGIPVFRPQALYGGGNVIAFIVPELFASKGIDWLNYEERDPEGNLRWANILTDVGKH